MSPLSENMAEMIENIVSIAIILIASRVSPQFLISCISFSLFSDTKPHSCKACADFACRTVRSSDSRSIFQIIRIPFPEAPRPRKAPDLPALLQASAHRNPDKYRPIQNPGHRFGGCRKDPPAPAALNPHWQ